MEKMLFSRHLDEVNDLKAYGRDAPIIESPENLERIVEIARKLHEKLLEDKKSAVLFITSPRIRAKQTAEMIARELKEMDGQNLKTRFSVNENLKATEQGDFVLPEEYRPDDVVVGLKLAGKIFDREVHGSDYPGMSDNIDYRFGDPIELEDGQYKYPELVGHFTKFGESYRETLIRLYGEILEMSKKYQSLLGKTETVIVAHGQTYHIFRGLLEIARRINAERVEFKTGDSPKLLWEIYKQCSDDEKVPGMCMPLEFDCLGDEKIMSILKEELDFLEQG